MSTALRSSLPPAAATGGRRLLSLPSAVEHTTPGRWLGGSFRRRAFRAFRVRIAVQTLFALTCLYLGWRFAAFVAAAQRGAETLPHRPPGVEGFLPISGLLGALDWIYSGTLNAIHPAATVLLLLFLATALLFRKAFCSWICPVGFLSDGLARLGRRVFGRNFRPWRVVDVPLRGLKYALLGFFVWVIGSMHPFELKAFLESPYNRIADVKMYLFFAPPGQFTLIVLGVLALLSVPIQGAWCRYLCPYGALLGLAAWASPLKIRRDPVSCTDCGYCDTVCPSRLPVSKSLAVSDVECVGCLDCVASCPEGNTLTIGTARRRVSPLAFAALLLALFALGYGAARVTGNWQSGTTPDQYRTFVRDADRLGHPGM